METSVDTKSRQKGAIWGMFIGDALAVPVHWYYDRQALARDCGRVTDYLADYINLLVYPLLRWLADPDESVVGRRLSTACYVENALPATAYLALKYHEDPVQGLIANTNLGGDNAGRGASGCPAGCSQWIYGLPGSLD